MDQLYFKSEIEPFESIELLPSEQEALFDIHGGLYQKTGDIHPKLFNITYQTFNKAIDNGFGLVKWGEPDWDFINELKTNNAVFAAFKTHHLQKDVVALLHDGKGQAKSFNAFRKDCEPIIGQYNRTWLQTEHNTALKRARVARQFKEYERNSDLYANLRWVPSTAAHPREGHQPFYGQVWPYSDTFWAHHMPGSLWGCQCGIEPTDEKPSNEPWETDTVVPDKGLGGNPVKTGKLFSDDNSYRANTTKGEAKAINKVMDGLMRYARLSERQKTYALPVAKQYNTHVEFANGGKVELHKLVKPNLNDPMDDFKDRLNFATAHAKEGNRVKMLPEIYKAEKAARTKLFPGLKNTSSNPDYLFNDKVYADLKRPSAIKNITGNANIAYKQGSLVVISDVRLGKQLTEAIINQRAKAILGSKNKSNYGFDEVWFYVKGKVIKYNRRNYE